jgi:hypothetical protein
MFVCGSCVAASAPPAASASRAASMATAAEALLTSGRDYARAAALLRGAIRIDPGSASLHGLLGSACADRAVSLSYALTYRKMLNQAIAEYPSDLKHWQDEQKDPKSPYHGWHAPASPRYRTFALKDDGRPLLLSNAAARREAKRLATEAQVEWTDSVRLARSQPEQAEMEEAFGWGLQLLRRAQQDVFAHPRVTGLALVPNGADLQSVRHLKAAARLAPGMAVYWQSVGDAVWLNRGGDLVGFGYDYKYGNFALTLMGPKADSGSPAVDVDTMVSAYRRSVALQPNNAAIWYRLFAIAKGSDEQAAISSLRRSILEDPHSALLHYEAAMSLFSGTHFDDVYDTPTGAIDDLIKQTAEKSTDADRANGDLAIGEMEAGASCKSFDAPEYEPPIPMVMRPAWDYWTTIESLNGSQSSDLGPLRELARQAAGFARVADYNHDEASASRAAGAIIAMGAELAGNRPATDYSFGDKAYDRALSARPITAIGLACNVNIAEKSGDPAAIAKAKAQWDAFESRETAYRKAVLAHLKNVNGIDSLFDAY